MRIVSVDTRRVLESSLAALERYPSLSSTQFPDYWNKIGLEYPWVKSLHEHSTEVRVLALSLRYEVSSFLGKDIKLWGSQLLERTPGQKHRWHQDVEALGGNTLNVWIALQGVSDKSGMAFIKDTENMTIPPRQRDTKTVLKISGKKEITYPQMKDGQGVVFDGRTWHSSFNDSSVPRYALLLQYATSDLPIKIPTNWDTPIRWLDIEPPEIYYRSTHP